MKLYGEPSSSVLRGPGISERALRGTDDCRKSGCVLCRCKAAGEIIGKGEIGGCIFKNQ